MSNITPEEARMRLNERPQNNHSASTPWLQILFLIAVIAGLGWWGYQQWLYRIPQNRILTLESGGTINARIMSHDLNMVKFAYVDTGDTMYVPLALLSKEDQEFLMHFDDVHAEAFYPINTIMAGPPHPGAKIQILGQAKGVLRYKELPKGDVLEIKTEDLSPVELAFLQRFHEYMPRDIEHTFTTKKGEALSGIVLGHDRGILALRLVTDGTTHYFPIEDLSTEDQRLLNNDNNSYSIDWPLDCTVYDNKGVPQHIIASGRVPNYLKLKDIRGVSEDYRPLTDYSAEDQKVFLLLQGSPMPHFPFTYTLTDATGRTLPVLVEGRTDLVVNIRLSNDTLMAYPIAKLSQRNQDFLRMFKSEADSPAIKLLRDQTADLELEDLRLEAKIADPLTSRGQKEIAQAALGRNQRQIDANTRAIAAAVREIEIDRFRKTGVQN